MLPGVVPGVDQPGVVGVHLHPADGELADLLPAGAGAGARVEAVELCTVLVPLDTVDLRQGSSVQSTHSAVVRKGRGYFNLADYIICKYLAPI